MTMFFIPIFLSASQEIFYWNIPKISVLKNKLHIFNDPKKEPKSEDVFFGTSL